MSPERRKNARLGLAIPVRVQGYQADGSTWEELSTTDDVSLGGICFPLSHEVELGQILHLVLALPRRLRQYDLTETTYRVYTLVRSVRRRPDQPRVGVMFFGKYPPRGFHDRPGARYLLPSDSQGGTSAPADDAGPPPDLPKTDWPKPPPEAPGPPPGPDPPTRPAPPEPPSPPPFDPPSRRVWEVDTSPESRPGVPPEPEPAAPTVEFHPSREVPSDRRGAPRVELFVNFTIQQVDEWGAVLQEELTVADNVGRGGARVMTTLRFQIGDVILLQEAGGGFATRAEVRGVTQTHPAAERLHLRFIDREAPARLLRQ
jgi:hypothetical protein